MFIDDFSSLTLSVKDDERADRQQEQPAAAADEQGPMTAVLVPPHRVSVMWTAWVFFKTFFSSLIPEGPQGLANWAWFYHLYSSCWGNKALWMKSWWKKPDVNWRMEKGAMDESLWTWSPNFLCEILPCDFCSVHRKLISKTKSSLNFTWTKNNGHKGCKHQT